MTETGYLKPLPRIDALNRPFWEAAQRDELALQRCTVCGTSRYPPNRWCPACRSDASEWVAISGKGVVWSFCVFHKVYFEGFAAEAPYAVVLVELDEGVRVYSNLVDVPREKVRIGMRVRAVYEKVADAVTLVKFAEDK
jgi:uncharacterized OB-fold protein